MSSTPDWQLIHAQRSFNRLWPRLEPLLVDPADRAAFRARLEQNFPTLFGLLHPLYGSHYDFFYHLEAILATAASSYSERAGDLKALDVAREADPGWFQSPRMVGGVCYVDLFAGTLSGIMDRIPYFKELGLTYLHLMPLFQVPDGENDGGYAVSSYRDVKPELGSMADLATLAQALRAEGISLVLDFVFNHTSDQHSWAKQALSGNQEFQEYYWMFPDRSLPDQYEANLREIFPEAAPGSFTYRPEVNQWVWTTFNRFQWDLNYSNPQVFNAMLQELLFLANQGVEIMRLDAVAFIWKALGTTCESLPHVHDIIQAYNALLRIAAPAMNFKSEAIVHPSAVASYIQGKECHLSYNPTMMALSWEALATREVELLRVSMQRWFDIPEDCAWVNYVRSHDDIGWTFADEDAAQLNINGFDHRTFLNRFYCGTFEGGFAVGAPFSYNPVTQDMRICGTCASLAGLEQALKLDNPVYIEHALRRVILLYSIALSAGGIPLIYLGDEIGTLNDYTYKNDPAKTNDSRWVHRPYFNWEAAHKRHDAASCEGRVFRALRHLIALRKAMPAFGPGPTKFFDTGNSHTLGYIRNANLVCFVNFSETSQTLRRDMLSELMGDLHDMVQDVPVPPGDLVLEAYQFVWLKTNEITEDLSLTPREVLQALTVLESDGKMRPGSTLPRRTIGSPDVRS